MVGHSKIKFCYVWVKSVARAVITYNTINTLDFGSGKSTNSEYEAYYDHLQIWRPYNIIGNESLNLSDHFHNVLIKEFCINKKKMHQFKGSEKDVRGYSSARKFCKSLIAKSKINKSFIYEYGNSNTITVKQVATIFKKIFEKVFDKKIKYNFNSSVMNINIIKSNKLVRSLDSKENSYKIIMKYYLSKIKFYEK
jgi:hypothetical protein